ncbi:MAG: M23 family metallopeptidase [Ignavibacteria bacterium]
MNRLKIFLFLFFISLYGISVYAQVIPQPEDDKPRKKILKIALDKLGQKVRDLNDDEEYADTPAKGWFAIMRQVRDKKLNRKSAVDSMNSFIEELNLYIIKNNPKVYKKSEWVFPVKGYTSSAIGGKNGSGYVVADFDFFDGNTGGHPAHDIFISDKNQDCLDDYTDKPVKILSMSGGIVVETRKNWTSEMMDIKGGNIVYIYDNFTDALFYYAHMNKVEVSVGDFVYPGMILGTMGRTGKNAFPSRSPTHLHIMYVKNYNGDIKSANLYDDLLKAKIIK